MPVATAFPVRFLAGAGSIEIKALVGVDLEENDSVGAGGQLHVGAGDVDGVEALVSWREPARAERKLHSIWEYLLTHTNPGAIERMRSDPALVPDSPALTVQTNLDGTSGFTIGLRQLQRSRAMWLPERDAFVTLGDEPVDFVKHLASLQGQRVLDRVKQEPEATRSRFLGLWKDVGDPRAWNVPWQSSWLGTTGHIVCVAPAHGSLSKFGIDRWGEVRPDLASEQKFRFDIAWPGRTWAGQRITNGLPVLVTKLEKGGQVSELEQLAVPLAARRGGEMTIVAFCSHVSH